MFDKAEAWRWAVRRLLKLHGFLVVVLVVDLLHVGLVGEELDVRMNRFFAGSNVEDSSVGFIDRFLPLPGHVCVIVAFMALSIRLASLMNNGVPPNWVVGASHLSEF